MLHQGELGHGSCGYVIRMEHKQSGEVMAVKVCYKLYADLGYGINIFDLYNLFTY